MVWGGIFCPPGPPPFFLCVSLLLCCAPVVGCVGIIVQLVACGSALGGDFPSYRSQAVQYGEPEGLPLADRPASHLPASPVSQPAALPSASAEPSPVFYSRASQCQSCSGPSQQHACQRLCSDYASARQLSCPTAATAPQMAARSQIPSTGQPGQSGSV